MRLLPALLLAVALPVLAQPNDAYPLRLQITATEATPGQPRASSVHVGWSLSAEDAAYTCAASVSFGSGSRNGPFIALSPTEGGCSGSGSMPPPDQLRVVRLRSVDGTLTVRIEGPPTNAGWEEGVAAARYRYAPANGDESDGATSVWIAPRDASFNIGMPPTVAINLGDLITK